MFDFGFSELLVIGIVALIVIGPERLPKVARTTGHLLGRIQRYVSNVKSDIEREMQLEELKKLQQQVEASARELESSVRAQADEVRQGVDALRQQVDAPTAEASGPVSSALPAGSATVAGRDEGSRS